MAFNVANNARYRAQAGRSSWSELGGLQFGYRRLICSKSTAATKYIDEYPVPGDIVECGVWAGGSLIAAKLAQNVIFHRDYWLFDTFQGMTPPSVEDGEIAQKAFDLESRRERDSNWLQISQRIVQKNIAQVTGNDEYCHYVCGPLKTL